ncbi:hypothetical protein RRG08_001728 [Elysia crispata]|uniref:Uncharacterized protein n=1 Tax=Elysia crispata TaxID=231223 RepID=A0AAE1AKR5_9GAST|nr:hypothetical protein RRG08_001728 [Elysia crispata]
MDTEHQGSTCACEQDGLLLEVQPNSNILWSFLKGNVNKRDGVKYGSACGGQTTGRKKSITSSGETVGQPGTVASLHEIRRKNFSSEE